MKELDRQCKHLQAQLNRSPSGVMLSPGTTCSGVSTRYCLGWVFYPLETGMLQGHNSHKLNSHQQRGRVGERIDAGNQLTV